MGSKVFRKTQFGQESTNGTGVAATAIWRGTSGMMDDTSVINFVEEEVANLGKSDRTNISKEESAISLDGVATFEQLGYLLAAGIKTVSGSKDGAGDGYIYEYTLPTTSANTIKTLTIENGDDTQAYEAAYCFMDKLTLSSRMAESVKVNAAMIGRKMAKTSFTTPLALATVEDIVFSNGKLYVDAVAGTIGTTQLTSTLLGFNMQLKTGWVPVMAADGNKYFSTIKNIGPELTMDVTFEYNANAVAAHDAFSAETPKLVRVIFEGSTFSNAGTTYSKKTLILDMAAKISKVPPVTDQDNNDVLTVSYKANYNATAAFFGEITLVNGLSALP